MREIIDETLGCLGVIFLLVVIGGLFGFFDSDSDKSSSDKVENFQGEYVLSSYSQDPSLGSSGWRFIVKSDKTVRAKLIKENGEEYDSPWLPGYWEEYPQTVDGHTIYDITIGDYLFYLDLKNNYATETIDDMKSKVPLWKITKVK
ncbi:MAG: hypothetical protein PUG09_03190 [Prevotella sp.]|nr:hypothetical protein [Prevotella sp.]